MLDKNEMRKDAESWPPLSYSGSWRNESIDTIFVTAAMGMFFHDHPRKPIVKNQDGQNDA